MRLSANDHPPGSSLGSECFRVLRRVSDGVSDLGSNVARIGSLHLLGSFNTDLLVRLGRSDGGKK